MENVFVAAFPVESEAYQAFSELKNDVLGADYFVSQAVLLKKVGNSINVCDAFNTGAETSDDTLAGTLIGSCIGVLGGPIGVLLGAGIGGMTGALVDTDDVIANGSIMEKVASELTDGTVAILGLSQEENTAALDGKFTKFSASVKRYDAAVVQLEVEVAAEQQIEMEKQARAALRKQKLDATKEKLEEKREKIVADFEERRKQRLDTAKEKLDEFVEKQEKIVADFEDLKEKAQTEANILE